MKMLKMKRRPDRDDLAEQRKLQVEQLYRQGLRQTEIADAVGVSQARVSQIMTTIERHRKNKRKMLRMMKADHPMGASA